MRPLKSIGEPLIYLDEVDSSNNYAMRQVQAHLAGHGAAFLAGYQTHGKGQRGRHWDSEHGQNIMLSCILNTKTLSIDNQFLLNVCISLGSFYFMKKYAIDDIFIKWPNDIYWKDRKAGGILIENIVQGKIWKFSIAGIGLNINQTLFSPALGKAVSIKQITGKNFDIVELAKELCDCLQQKWKMLADGNTSELLEKYNNCLYKKGEFVILKSQQATFSAKIAGVNIKGELMAEVNDHAFVIPYGSVQWML